MKLLLNRMRTGAAALSVLLALGACSGGNDTRSADLAREIDSFLQPYLSDNGITAATLTVMQDGMVIYEKAYGFKDVGRTTALPTDALMTTASIVKPVTAAAIQKLASLSQLRLDDKAFCGPGVIPSALSRCWIANTWVTSTDTRILDITISHLLAHQGGWDRSATTCYAYQNAGATIQQALIGNGNPCDPIQHEFIVQADANLGTPPSLEDDVKYFMRGNLDFPPGSTPLSGDRYSNFGYMLLGLIVERASGSPFNAYVNTAVLSPLGVSSSDFKTSQSLLINADPREPNYITSKTGPSVFAPGTTVSARDGMINAPNFEAAATSITTSRAMATFASRYKIDTDTDGVDGPSNGVPLDGSTHEAFHYGDLPGTAAVLRQLRSGISYAILMNKNDKYETACPRNYPSAVRDGLDNAIAAAGYTERRLNAGPRGTGVRVEPRAC